MEYGPSSTEVITHDHLWNDVEKSYIVDLKDRIAKKVVPASEHLKDVDINTIMPEKTFSNEPEFLFLGTISMKPGIDR